MVVRINDTLILNTVENGEIVSIAKGNPVSVTDQVLMYKLPDGTFITHGNDNIEIGDTILINKMINGEYVAVKGGNCFLITKGYTRPLPYNRPIPPGTLLVTDFFGVFKYKWDGKGRVYVSSSCCANIETDTIVIDDELIVVNSEGKYVTCAYNGPSGGAYTIPGPDLEITSLLVKGFNELQFYVHDIFGGDIGILTSLYISQTYLNEGGSHLLITNGGFRPITTTGVETDTIATITYNWDGNEKIFISSSYCADPATDNIIVDDQLIVTNGNDQSVSVSNPSSYNPKGVPDLDITSLLIKGDNKLTFQIHDIFGVGIGCGPLYLVQY